MRYIPLLLLLAAAAGSARAQSLTDYTEFYRNLRLNAVEEFVFCYPTAHPEHEPSVVGVRRDTLGRPVEIAGFFFGNPDTRGDWTIIRIDYQVNPANGNVLQRRTFHGVGGVPITVGWSHGEEVLRRSGGELLLRRMIGTDLKVLAEVPTTTSTMYTARSPQEYMQEWFYGRGRQHVGVGFDGPMRPFGSLPDGAYFRHFQVDERGNLLAEALWDIQKQPIAFPGGEFIRLYTVNDCGQTVRVEYLDIARKTVATNEGIAAETFEYDNYGRVIHWRGFDADGAPAARRSDGAAEVRYEYRPHDGVLLGEQRFDVDGEPIAAQ